jgi:hypothetical protein
MLQLWIQRLFITLCVCASCTVSSIADTSTPLVVTQWVRMEGDKPLEGHLVSPQLNGNGLRMKRACVVIVGEDGVSQRVETDTDGKFAFANVTPGIYTLAARSERSLSIVALHVVNSADENAKAYPTTIEMPAATIDVATVKMAITRYLPPDASSLSTVSMKKADLAHLAPKVLSDQEFRVGHYDGGMRGRIYTAGADGASLPNAMKTNVFIMKDGEEVARAITDDLGRFEIKDLPLGQYSLLTLGASGLGLVGFELVDESKANTALNQSALSDGNTTLVAQEGCGCVEEIEIQCAPIPEVVACVEEIIETPCCEDEIVVEEEVISEGEFVNGMGATIPGGGVAGGGYAGGGFGGAGTGGFGGTGVGGIGGGAGLLGLAAAGGIAAAAIAGNQDSGNNAQVEIVSP